MGLYRLRIFYDLSTGKVKRSNAAEGDLQVDYTPEQEAEDIGLTNCGVFAWDEPDPEIEAALAPFDAGGNPRIVTVTVDVTVSPPVLQFAYEPPPEPETGDDPYEIIDIMSGEV